jgi:chromosome segregation ATPase
MVTLEQIRALEARVEKAVVLIDKLRKENAELEQRLVDASRSDEQIKSAYSELERKTSASIRSTSESAAKIEDLASKLVEAESRVKDAELRAAEAEERAAALDRKAQAAEAENATYRDRALAAEHRSADLESKAEELRHEQSRIEEGLTHALEKLDAFEDLVMGISVGNSDVSSAGTQNASDRKQDAGETKVEAVEESSSTTASQASPFPGTAFDGGPFNGETFPGSSSPGGDGNELDIF